MKKRRDSTERIEIPCIQKPVLPMFFQLSASAVLFLFVPKLYAAAESTEAAKELIMRPCPKFPAHKCSPI